MFLDLPNVPEQLCCACEQPILEISAVGREPPTNLDEIEPKVRQNVAKGRLKQKKIIFVKSSKFDSFSPIAMPIRVTSLEQLSRVQW